MGGGLLELSFVGKQEAYLVGSPQITFFKSVYKHYTNFSMQSIECSVSGDNFKSSSEED